MQVGQLRLAYSHRPPSAPMGRFGGGWQWKMGVQAGRLSRQRGTVLLALGISELRVSWGGG